MLRHHTRMRRQADCSLKARRRMVSFEGLEGRVLLALAIPGTIQMEDFNAGGEGVGYHDTTPANLGGKYRPGEGVDIESTTDTGGGYDVGWTAQGEWLKYTVSVAKTAAYDAQFRVASPYDGGYFHMEVDGVEKTSALYAPKTGGWQSWQTLSKNGVVLSAGTHTIKMVFDAAAWSGPGFVGNFNWIRFTASSRAGDPDVSFGNLGSTALGSDREALGQAVQTDGRIVVLESGDLMRLNGNGTVDSTFGSGGKAGLSSSFSPAQVTIQPDGRILVAGTVNNNFAVARFNSAGAMDSGFGSGGVATVDFGQTDAATSLVVQRDGKIVLGGSSAVAGGAGVFAAARLNGSGVLDSTFGTAGRMRLTIAATTGFTGLALQPDGRIVGCGEINGALGVLRLTTAGALDTSFGGGHGYSTAPLLTYQAGSTAIALALAPDGKIVVVGGSWGSMDLGPDIIARFNTSGAVDKTFGGGVVVQTMGPIGSGSVAVQPNGKILVGSANVLQRFTSSGALDSAFGTDGQVPAGSHVTIQPDGKILAGGYGDMFMARYLGDAPVPTPFNNAPLPVSAPIQCEDFDNLGYYDATPANATGQYRYTPVDIEKCGDTGGGYDVCYAKPGEWLRYTLNVTTAKTYAFQTRVAALGTGGKFHLELDGVSLGSVAVPNTGGWGTYTSVAAGSKALTAGTHTLKLVMDTAGSGGYVGNFNWIRLS